jgi:23S rRNA-/tRNA-specific pseudouridylate synthase
LPWNRERFGVFPGGREAVTKYKLLSVFSIARSVSGQPVKPITEYSLLEVIPQTGRTHQIRVHLKYAGHPVVGDLFYAGRKTAREDRKFCPRLFLHAIFLRITHPTKGTILEFKSALPKDLQSVLDRLPDYFN